MPPQSAYHQPPRKHPFRRHREREEKSGVPLGLILGLCGGGAALLLVLGLVLFLTLGRSGDSNFRSVAKTQKTTKTPRNPAINQQGDVKQVAVHPDVPLQPLPTKIDPATVRQVKDATVYLRVTTPTGQLGEGSGFLALEPGIVITNAHVLGMLNKNSRPPKKVDVVLHSGEPHERSFRGEILGVDRETDLAVIRVQGNLPTPLKLDLRRELVETQEVYVFGFPFGEDLGKNITVSPASVSSLRKDATGTLEKVQVMGDMHPGNSGGPVVNSLGQVVGVSVSIIRGTRINFAIPAHQVKLLLEGRLLDSHIGEPYRVGGQVRVPVRYTCLDPFKRIRELKVEVCTGQPGKTRPFSLAQPPAFPGDGPKQVQSLSYSNGLCDGEVVLPTTQPGQVVWIRPVIVSATQKMQWGPALFSDPTEAIERQPAELVVKLMTHEKRTVRLKSSRCISFIRGEKESVVSDTVEVSVLESLSPNPKGVLVSTGFSLPRISYEDQGVKRTASSQIGNYIKRIPPRFVVDSTNKLCERADTSLGVGMSSGLKQDVNSFYRMICNGYELCNIPLPNRQMQPQQTWNTAVPMLIRTDSQAKIYDLILHCKLEGIRNTNGGKEAVVTVQGNVEGRGDLRGKSDGKVKGRFTFNVSNGYISSAKMAITAESALTKDFQIVSAFDVELTRAPGNPLNLKVGSSSSPSQTVSGEKLGRMNSWLDSRDPMDFQFGSRGSRVSTLSYQIKSGKR